MKTQIVIGLGFGDEGKGTTTDMLACQSKDTPALVVRFSGGHQAGHTVWKKRDGKLPYTHVFAQIGAGALSGASTLYSKYCTFYPLAFVREYESIKNYVSNFEPKVYVDPLAPVTTLYDVAYNRVIEKINNHGSCGVGFAATVKRHETCKVYAQDIAYIGIFESKLATVEEYYKNLCYAQDISYHMIEEFLTDERVNEYAESMDTIRTYQNVSVLEGERDVISKYGRIIFEGSQGVMLDMEWGFFPNVTRSHTTSRNAMEIIERNGLPMPEVFYVTRSYSTRHGNGDMPNNEKVPFVREISEETNKTNEWQGSLRTGILDAELLQYAIRCDSNYTRNCTKNLVVTCLDQVASVNVMGVGKVGTVKTLLGELKLPETSKVFGGFSPYSEDIVILDESLGQASQGVKKLVSS